MSSRSRPVILDEAPRDMPTRLSQPDIQVLRIIGLLDPKYGGPSESSVSACIATQRSGVKNTFVFGVAAGSRGTTFATQERLANEGVAVRPFPVTRIASYYAQRWGLSLSLCYWVTRHVRRFDVVHLHQTWGLPQTVGLIAAAISRRPCVITPHESLTSYDVEREKSFVKRWLRERYMRHASLILFASDLEAADSISEPHEGKITVLPHPLGDDSPSDTVIYAGGNLGDQSRPTRALTVGFLGRLHPKKNVDLIIKAIASLPDDICLRVAGDGLEEYKSWLMSCAREVGVAERVEWLGFVSRDDRWNFFNEVDLLALVSEYECFGVAAAEAMAHGVAVVVSDRTGIASIVTKYGCGFVVAADVASVAEALRAASAEKQELAGLGARGRTAVRNDLSMKAYGSRVRHCYEELIAAY